MFHCQPARLTAIAATIAVPLCFVLLIFLNGSRLSLADDVVYASLAGAPAAGSDTTPAEGFLQLPFKPLPGQSHTGLDNVIVWFDHEYPLLPRAIFPSSGLEPETDGVGNTVMIYTGDEKPWCFNGPPRPDCYHYTGHNGYDYSFGVTAGTVISAAHSGFVTIPPFSNCSLYSVDITSDDGRYQTRYLHLAPDVTTAGYVEAGDYIGHVASVVTRCMKGPHLHLTVLFDANDDGHFVTDEKVDPYGWLPTGQTDPWTTTFQDRLGDWHTGTPSEWLWSFSPPARAPMRPGEATQLTTRDGLSLQIPAGAVDAPAELSYFIVPEPTGGPDGPAAGFDGTVYRTLRAGVTFALRTVDGRPDALRRPADLTIYYTQEDAASVEEASLALYQWHSGDGQWILVPSTLDRPGRAVRAAISQFGLFSLRGRPLLPAPEITAVQLGNSNRGRPDVLVISGRHFAADPLINLEFNQLEVISASPTSIVARIPEWVAAGQYTLRLQNPDGQTAFWSGGYVQIGQ